MWRCGAVALWNLEPSPLPGVTRNAARLSGAGVLLGPRALADGIRRPGSAQRGPVNAGRGLERPRPPERMGERRGMEFPIEPR